MKLSVMQRAALVRMVNGFWEPPKGKGCIQYGFSRTLYSLQNKGLTRFIRAGEYYKGMLMSSGWVLTDEGEKQAAAIAKDVAQKTCKDWVEVRKAATR